MKKLLIVFGTRPEAIKLCPLIRKLQKHPDEFQTIVCVTAQHRHMVDQFLTTFEVMPDYDLNLMRDNQTLFDLTSRAIVEIGNVIDIEKPAMIIVQGDTTTTFVACLAAYYHKVSIGHVEAGLRTQDKYSPFPEEVNRRLTSVMADIHFAPTELSKHNLLVEGVPSERIIVTGNTVIDALLWVRGKIKRQGKSFGELSEVNFDNKVILVTGHRRENFGQGLRNVFSALRELAGTHKEVEIVYPVHLNPNVRKPVQEFLAGIPNVKLLEPLGYEPFIYLMDNCHFIISDSGGIQEEAPSLGKPVLVTRDTTERLEVVGAGSAKLVGTSKERILSEAEKLLNDPVEYQRMSMVRNPYGDARACKRIVSGLLEYFN